MKQQVVDVIMKHEIEETPGFLKFKDDMSSFDIPEAEVRLAWIRLTDENKKQLEDMAKEIKNKADTSVKKSADKSSTEKVKKDTESTPEVNDDELEMLINKAQDAYATRKSRDEVSAEQ